MFRIVASCIAIAWVVVSIVGCQKSTESSLFVDKEKEKKYIQEKIDSDQNKTNPWLNAFEEDPATLDDVPVSAYTYSTNGLCLFAFNYRLNGEKDISITTEKIAIGPSRVGSPAVFPFKSSSDRNSFLISFFGSRFDSSLITGHSNVFFRNDGEPTIEEMIEIVDNSETFAIKVTTSLRNGFWCRFGTEGFEEAMKNVKLL